MLYSEHLAEAGIDIFIGSVGDARDGTRARTGTGYL
jgi:hypothetical protein